MDRTLSTTLFVLVDVELVFAAAMAPALVLTIDAFVNVETEFVDGVLISAPSAERQHDTSKNRRIIPSIVQDQGASRNPFLRARLFHSGDAEPRRNDCRAEACASVMSLKSPSANPRSPALCNRR